jgi:hypothetical protein
MLELLILWNVSALREERREDTDFTIGIVGVWIMLQLLIWPLSAIALLRKTGLSWLLSILAASAFAFIGYLIGGESFYLGVGILSMVGAACLVSYAVVSDA